MPGTPNMILFKTRPTTLEASVRNVSHVLVKIGSTPGGQMGHKRGASLPQTWIATVLQWDEMVQIDDFLHGRHPCQDLACCVHLPEPTVLRKNSVRRIEYPKSRFRTTRTREKAGCELRKTPALCLRCNLSGPACAWKHVSSRHGRSSASMRSEAFRVRPMFATVPSSHDPSQETDRAFLSD